jgi:ATP-binding cassette subfamily B protein
MLLVLGSIGGMLWVGGQDVLAKRVTPGELAAFVFYALIVASSLGFLSEVIGDLQRAAGATERLMELLNAQSEILDPVHPKPLPTLVRGSIEVHNLHFRYPSRPNILALEEINLHIEPGMTMAIVGPSGAGKSTLLELLLRFYDPLQGSILFEGIDLRLLTLYDLRQQIAFVPQQPTLFSANVWKNLLYGRPDASKEEILAATRDANAEEFLNALPQGFDSFLGEQGVRLSGGQRQRLAIARAILRDPKVLLLDEATSALDSESERMVQEALLRLMQKRTTIVIAHRLATVIHADQITVIDQNRVVALGTHQQLLRISPLYSRLAELQFRQEAIRAA